MSLSTAFEHHTAQVGDVTIHYVRMGNGAPLVLLHGWPQTWFVWRHMLPPYLSKILTKLVKAGMISSTPGINGGYKLTRNKTDLSFLEVIHAIEGTASLFRCDDGEDHQGCLIQHVMTHAEQQMEAYLKERKLVELVGQLGDVNALA
jgi:Rrf2 family protein